MTNGNPRYFIPAAPGYWVLDLSGSDAPGRTFKIWRYPVIAWEATPLDEDKPEGDCFAIPVVTDWECGSPRHSPILGPDGRVRVPGETTYDSEKEWFDAAKKERKRQPTMEATP